MRSIRDAFNMNGSVRDSIAKVEGDVATVCRR